MAIGKFSVVCDSCEKADLDEGRLFDHEDLAEAAGRNAGWEVDYDYDREENTYKCPACIVDTREREKRRALDQALRHAIEGCTCGAFKELSTKTYRVAALTAEMAEKGWRVIAQEEDGLATRAHRLEGNPAPIPGREFVKVFFRRVPQELPTKDVR